MKQTGAGSQTGTHFIGDNKFDNRIHKLSFNPVSMGK